MERDLPSVETMPARDEGHSRPQILSPDNAENYLSATDDSDVEEMLARQKSVSKTCGGGKYSIHHVIVFMLTFWSFAFFHATRKTFSNVKSTVTATWMPQNLTDPTFKSYNMIWNEHRVFLSATQAQSFLGILDAVFMFCYAAGLFVSGILGDRFDPRLVLTVGMWGTAFVNLIFGFVMEQQHFYSVPLYLVLWILNGFLQSTGWPAEVCIMGDWYGRSSRGLVLGIWSACASVGNIVGAYLAADFLPYGYEYAFLVNSSLLFAGGIVVFFGLVSRPKEIGIPDPEEDQKHDATKALLPTTSQENVASSSSSNVSKGEAIGFWRAFMLPGVIAYSAAYACLKLINYSIFFWLPYYLTNNFQWSEEVAGQVSTWYDWGGIIGGTLAGVLSDWMGKRTPVIMGQLFFALISLGVYTACPNNETIAGALMGIVGFFIGGAANLISAAVSADLGRQEALRGDSRALSTVTGIVDGTGSVGAALGQVLIPVIQMWLGWNAVFGMFMVMTVMTAVCLAKLCWTEVKDLRSTWRRRYDRLSDFDSTE